MDWTHKTWLVNEDFKFIDPFESRRSKLSLI